MALRYFCNFRDHHDYRWKIEVFDSAYSGAEIEFTAGGDGCTIRWSGSGTERTLPIVGSECVFQMDMATEDHLALLDDLSTAAENRFVVRILKGLPVGTTLLLEWAGTVTSDITRYPDQKPFFFEIRATDGLASLKTELYDNAGVAYTGMSKLTDILLRCLNKINSVTQIYSSTELLMQTTVDYFETNYVNNGTNDPLALTYANNEVFIKTGTKGERKPFDCYEVIETIMKPYGCRMIYLSGSYRIEQVEYTASPYILRRYLKNGTTLSAVNNPALNVIDQTKFGALVAVGMYEYYPPLKWVTVDFETQTRRNLIDGIAFTQSKLDHDFFQVIEGNSGLTTLRWSGAIQLQLTNNAYTPGVFESLLFSFQLKIRIGDKILFRDYIIQNFQIQYSDAEWVDFATNPLERCAQVISVTPCPAIGSTSSFTINTDYTTPPIPVDGADYSVGFKLVNIRKFDGSSVFTGDFTINYQIDNNWMEVYSYGSPALNETNESYICVNPVTGNTATEDIDVSLGDGSNPNALGALRWLDGSIYRRTSQWGQGTGPRNLRVGQLLCRSALSGQATAIRRLNGTFHGRLNLAARYTWAEKRWMMINGSYNATFAEITGDFVEMIYTLGLTPSPTIKKIIKLSVGNQVPTVQSSNNGPNSSTDQPLAMPVPTILTGVASNTIAAALLSGATTSVGLTDALGAGEYIAGDILSIVNPLTGQTESLTVTADSTAGATTVAVSGTIKGNYPQGAYIIKKKKTGYQLNDRRRVQVTTIGSSIVLTVPAAEQPRKSEHLTLVVGRLPYTQLEGDFTITKAPTTLTLGSINTDCAGLNGYVEWFY